MSGSHNAIFRGTHTHTQKHSLISRKHRHRHTHARMLYPVVWGLTIPVSPGVLAAAGAEREGGSGDVQVLDQMTEPVHDPVRHLPALSQKLMQGHECRLLVSHAQTNCHPGGWGERTPRRRCRALLLHTRAKLPKVCTRAWEGSSSQNQDDMLS